MRESRQAAQPPPRRQEANHPDENDRNENDPNDPNDRRSLDDSLPLPAVHRPLDREDADTMRLGVAPRLARRDDAVTELQRRPRHGILGRRELRAGTPLEIPDL